jgi:hypothetical protein
MQIAAKAGLTVIGKFHEEILKNGKSYRQC